MKCVRGTKAQSKRSACLAIAPLFLVDDVVPYSCGGRCTRHHTCACMRTQGCARGGGGGMGGAAPAQCTSAQKNACVCNLLRRLRGCDGRGECVALCVAVAPLAVRRRRLLLVEHVRDVYHLALALAPAVAVVIRAAVCVGCRQLGQRGLDVLLGCLRCGRAGDGAACMHAHVVNDSYMITMHWLCHLGRPVCNCPPCVMSPIPTQLHANVNKAILSLHNGSDQIVSMIENGSVL